MTNTQFLHVLGNACRLARFSIGVAPRRRRELHKVVATDPDEVRPYCCFDKPAEKERGAVDRFTTRFKAWRPDRARRAFAELAECQLL